MKSRVAALEARNARVEADKAWETSLTRRAAIMAVTYAIVVIFLHQINAVNPWLNALVPACGYLLSTLSLPYLKQAWLDKKYKK